MKLTMTIRGAFARAAMLDVPKTDYDEQISAVILADAVAALPPIIRKLWDEPSLRPYVHQITWALRLISACRTAPVVQNVVADFAKAGWPKGAV